MRLTLNTAMSRLVCSLLNRARLLPTTKELLAGVGLMRRERKGVS